MGLAVAVGALAACQSSEEKAEGHYQAGLELLAAGDADRALVEFRNVFQLNGQHREARQTYARVQRERGNLREAYGQYLRLVEQYPDDLEGNLALAEMGFQNGSWEDAGRYARRALTTAPDDPLAQALVLVADYRDALMAKDTEKTASLLESGASLLKAHPEILMLRKMLADEALRGGKPEEALALIDEGLKLAPGEDEFYQMRLAILHQLDRKDEVTAQLKEMVARKPEDAQLRNTLISWYVAQNDLEAAEAGLRAEIDPAKDELEPQLRLVQFLLQIKGVDAARAELDALIAARPDSVHLPFYRSMLANIRFDQGERDAAIAEMQKILEESPDAPQVNGIRLTLARMMTRTGNEVGARALVEQVLEADRTDTGALKMKAGWLIDDDKTGDALVVLRTALEQSPRDAEAMTLMARAHERDGSLDLAGEMLALAVEASQQGVEESLRYASFLQGQQKLQPAEDALLNALRRAPQDLRLLGALSQLYIRLGDWPRVDNAIASLESIDTERAQRLAQELRAQSLAARGQSEELTKYLEQLAQGEGGTGAEMALVRDAVRRGDLTQALTQSTALRDKMPDVPQVALLHALVLNSAGRADDALTELQALTKATPQFEQGWLALVNMQRAQGNETAAEASLAAALEAMPTSRTMRWMQAGDLERSGDVEGAIALYEVLYAEDSNWAIVANNLASLLANNRSDAESLERAYVIARRLRGIEVPAFQDTYGWIAFRRGNLDEALAHLEPAARGLPGDMSVQYHLAMAYGATGRRDEALVLLKRVAEANPAPAPALLAAVQAEIARLEATPAATGNTSGGTQGN
jgi:predicted Zn-dependent protease